MLQHFNFDITNHKLQEHDYIFFNTNANIHTHKRTFFYLSNMKSFSINYQVARLHAYQRAKHNKHTKTARRYKTYDDISNQKNNRI